MVVLFAVTLHKKKFGEIWHQVKWRLFFKHENTFSFSWNTYLDKKGHDVHFNHYLHSQHLALDIHYFQLKPMMRSNVREKWPWLNQLPYISSSAEAVSFKSDGNFG